MNRQAGRGASHLASLLFILAATFAAGCRPGAPAPEPIRPEEDSCATCRMQVSQPCYAAQVISPRGEHLKFDDIGCFLQLLKSEPALAAAPSWVAHRETGAWIGARSAVFALETGERTPMGSGILAFGGEEEARARGKRVARLPELLK